MFIREFYSKLMSAQEKSGLFDALRRVSRLETEAVLAGTADPGWVEWPPTGDDSGSLGWQLNKA